MAKKFAGFKPDTIAKKILPSLGYNGPTDQKSIAAFLAASPSAAAKMGEYTMVARQMVEGKTIGGMNTGGQADKMTKKITSDPTSIVTTAPIVADQGSGTMLQGQEGQAGAATQATAVQTGPAAQATAQPQQSAATVAPATAAQQVASSTAGVTGAVGTVSNQADPQAAQADPTKASSLGLQAAQQQGAQQVQAPAPMQMTADQTISGSTVDQAQVDQTFGTGQVEAASVKDELDDLMQDFQGGNTPAWAAGAMRSANAAMAARGLSASSMAGMAVVQAAMESALPIAQADAANKQQMAMLKAEQRAAFMGMKFDQNFQTKVKNAARISEIANINFSAEQQVALENAKMAQTVDLANLSNRQAKVMADAATMSQMDMANLDNRQRANMQRAQSFLQMDMANLDNEQQASMFKAQENVNAILSDTAAVNAAQQFNATSENQTNQFFASLGAQVEQFNTEQTNAMARFNAGEANAIEQFNVAQENARDQFNAQNHLVVAQANAQWAQSVTTASNAAANQANRDAALAANNLTMTAYNNVVQRERDVLAWAWQSAENAKELDGNIAVAKISASGGSNSKNFLSAAGGKFLGQLAINAADIIFGK